MEVLNWFEFDLNYERARYKLFLTDLKKGVGTQIDCIFLCDICANCELIFIILLLIDRLFVIVTREWLRGHDLVHNKFTYEPCHIIIKTVFSRDLYKFMFMTLFCYLNYLICCVLIINLNVFFLFTCARVVLYLFSLYVKVVWSDFLDHHHPFCVLLWLLWCKSLHKWNISLAYGINKYLNVWFVSNKYEIYSFSTILKYF